MCAAVARMRTGPSDRAYPGRVTRRGIVSAEDQDRINRARSEMEAKEADFRRIVLEVTTRSSVRETAKAAGIGHATVERWMRGE